MQEDGKNNGKNNKREGIELSAEASMFLYLCNFIHEGYYNIRITWGEVRSILSFALSGKADSICKELEKGGYAESCEDQDPFMILRRIEASIPEEKEEWLISRFFDVMSGVPLAYNVAILSYLQRSLMVGIIGSFYDHELRFASTPEERVLVSAVTSESFLSGSISSRHFDGIISDIPDRERDMSAYMSEPWFNELILIIKNGYYGNGSFNYIDTLESSFRVEFTSVILEIIRNGDLLWLILNFRSFVKSNRVDSSIKKFVRKRKEEKTVNRAYDWLSIGNDFAVGIEFLVGSVEFLPNYDSTFGVYLFIIGSTQLLIRPVINLARKIHLHKLQRRKIRF